MWYLEWSFWVGLGIAFIIWILSYYVRVYFMKLLFWYQRWAFGFNNKAYQAGQNLRKKYDERFGNGYGKTEGIKMH